MQILVNYENLDNCLESLADSSRLSLDTETTGLEPFHGDKFFSIFIADQNNEYCFDTRIGGLHKIDILPQLQGLLDSTEYLFFVNYDYDFSICAQDNLFIDKSKILDAGVMARLEYSLHDPSGRKAENQFFSLDYLAKYYLKQSKDSSVEDYIREHNLYGEDRHGKKKPQYDKVPKDIMLKYGCSDVRLTYDICTEILRRINFKDTHYESSRPKSFPTIMEKLKNESKLSTALAVTKLKGLRCDIDYCKKAFYHETAKASEALAQIQTETKLNVNSPKQVSDYLRNVHSLELPKIIKRGKWTGGYSTDASTLHALSEKHNLPMLDKIVECKQSQKKANTYYKNYLKLIDANGIIHCGLGQETTVTGRLSSYNPNLQNVPKEKYHEWAVRNAFIAERDSYLFCIDYKAQEMRIMIDLSGDQKVIEKVKEGEDIYLAMAAMVKDYTNIEITRSQAKALSLGVAYGQGYDLIAKNLGCSREQAKKLKHAFLNSLKGVKALDEWCKKQSKLYGKIHNPYGRVTFIERGFEYKTLNALIQGTAADCTKKAFVDCFEYLKDFKSFMPLCVHDELIFNIHRDEIHVIDNIKQIMIKAYPHRSLPLDVDVEVSKTSWAAKELVNECKNF